MNDENKRFMGDNLNLIFSGKDVWNHQDVKIKPSSVHTVLFKLPIHPKQVLEPFRRQDVWDAFHVRMPHSENSRYDVIDEFGIKSNKCRFELIQTSLLNKFENSYQLEEAIKKYNSRYENIWNFSSLHQLIEHEITPEQKQFFFSELLPNIINLALNIQDIVPCPIPLLKQEMNHSISMTQQQAACLLANAFLCTFPRRNTEKRNSEFSNYPEINFNRLFGSDEQASREKLKCMLNYFERVCKNDLSFQKGVITFQRRSMNEFPDYKNDLRKLSDIKYHVTVCDSIEESYGCLQVDFANKFVGGGVLGGGCVQEEIRFVMNPELIVAKLFTECLGDGEALIITGTEQFNMYIGYASTFQFDGNYNDKTPLDDCNRRKTRIVAIDALPYRSYYDQFKEENLKRDINKALVGFTNNNDADKQPVATGLWGAGAFHGHPIRSAIIQFMACRMTQRNLIFYTFGDETMEFQVFDIFQFLSMNNVTIGEVFEILKKFRYSEKTKNVEDLVPFIKKLVIANAKNISSKFVPSTSSANSSSHSNSGNLKNIKNEGNFKQKSLFEFRVSGSKPKNPQESQQPHQQQSMKKSEKESVISKPYNMVLPRFSDTNANNDKDRFESIEAKFKDEPISKPTDTKPQKHRPSLLESLDDDFGKE